MTNTEPPTVVFIPGAWHLPEAFDTVRRTLTTRGYPTTAISLRIAGAESPTKSLSDDMHSARFVVEQLVDEGKQVVVVAHSYGGLVSSGAVKELGFAQRRDAGLNGGVIMLVYMAAFAATKGSSVLDLLGGRPQPFMKFADDDYVYTIDQAHTFYNDLPPAEQERWTAKLQRMSKHAFLEPASYEPWHNLPCMYLLCELDQALPIAVQEMMAGMLGEQAVNFRCAASHSPFLSVPDKVADAVELGLERGRRGVGFREP